MMFQISQDQIGKRIVALRKRKQFSQEDLAKRIGISRPSLTQIELGKRSLNVLELQKFAQVLHFSLDDFMSENFSVATSISIEEVVEETVAERVSVPKLNVGKMKNILLYILEHCAGKPNVGETVLYKLLYFSDFNYYELYEEQMTGATYRKLPFGPIPQNLDSILSDMIENNQIQLLKMEYHGYPQTRYIPMQKADLTLLMASEKEVIDRVVEQMSDWSATAISNYAYKDMPWLFSKEGEDINYELAFYRELPFSVRNYQEEDEL
ncbi:type II toxin-antitoxin system antitoxin SocA domain-containing protein [Flavobacterium sp. 7A]|uniref:type II toxin-antitoxin system antitoxin SocA domain-containing protein n=1 Tax=Flavobacterium sp. 7A TaxID=2940571 RepID=UPI0022272F8B|nr:type II toxin-antitoxin system antitoxin SocA domain-containing protein [Flavobacterium sp. 7A]MCW2117947.1 transcriptional regulator with XRE-family HTH domain [Flavobacterium sp. 7A]